MKIFSPKPIFFTPERQRFLLRRIFLPAVVVHASLCAAATVNNYLVKSPFRAAVLISDYALTSHDSWASPVAFFGAYPYWTFYFNNRGMETHWFLHARVRDLARVIRDETFQSIVLVGHGSLNSWQSMDRLVTNNDVRRMMQGRAKKRGEWIQLTCAVKDLWPVKLGELVMDPRKVYTYQDEVNTLYFVADAVSGFKLIKSRAIKKQPSIRVRCKTRDKWRADN